MLWFQMEPLTIIATSNAHELKVLIQISATKIYCEQVFNGKNTYLSFDKTKVEVILIREQRYWSKIS